MKLVIVHSHYRPGGVRRIIELAAPHLVAALHPAVAEVIMVGGEPPDARWRDLLVKCLGGLRVTWMTDSSLGYCSELPDSSWTRTGLPRLARQIHGHLGRALRGATPQNCVVWAHNQGLGRNLLVTRELGRLCAARGLPLVFHHHDWWFDNRWTRWPEMRRAGFRTIAGVARTILPTDANVRHAAINQADADVLQRHFGPQAGWLPNLSEPSAHPPVRRVRAARRWLAARLGNDAPVWIVPCRLLRRKNLAEALLIMRWLRPEAWLVTTGGVSSADERAYAAALSAAGKRHGWPMRLGVLAGGEASTPTVAELMEASEAVLLTSIQEGFGLPNLEAAAAARPLIARRLPNTAPDLARFGFRFPQAYDDVLVDTRLFDWPAEIRRQTGRWHRWRAALPRACRPPADAPPLLIPGAAPSSVPFSRLTLIAQIEVLAQDPNTSWADCAPLNPFLQRWRRHAANRELEVSVWPRRASRWLDGPAYARRWLELLAVAPATSVTPRKPGTAREHRTHQGVNAVGEFIRSKLARENQYPLLWTLEP